MQWLMPAGSGGDKLASVRRYRPPGGGYSSLLSGKG